MTQVRFLDLTAANRELRADLDAAYRSVAEGPTLVLGEQVAAFEHEFAAYTGASHCIGVGNGFDALHLGLRALGVSLGDEVLVPANTYVATWLAVSAAGATPIGVEPIESTSNIDPDRLDGAVTERTKAIIPVHLYGQPADMSAICQWADSRGISVLADAAQAHGATHRGSAIGALGDVVAWSFYPTKNLGALGDGGAVTTDDAQLADQVRLLRSYGADDLSSNLVQGFNSRLDELQAAFLRVKLGRLDEANRRRRKLAARYLDELAGLDLQLPEVAPEAGPVWHQFVVRVDERAALRRRLTEAGVETMVHYPTPPHLQPAYARAGANGGTFPIAERLAERVLSLPIAAPLSDADQERVLAALRQCL